MIDCLWGLKTVAIFDVWTIEHVLSGLSVGHAVKKDNHRHFKKHHPKLELMRRTRFRVDLIAVLFVAYMWETLEHYLLEHYLEEGLDGQTVAYWFEGEAPLPQEPASVTPKQSQPDGLEGLLRTKYAPYAMTAAVRMDTHGGTLAPKTM
jgi:hypothetical protein